MSTYYDDLRNASFTGLSAGSTVPSMEFDPPRWGRASGTVYLAGPITGLTYGEARFGWRQYVAGNVNPAISVLSPMRNEDHLKEQVEAINDAMITFDSRAIVEKDFFDIDRSDILFVNLQGATQPRGTLVEMGYARAKGKFIILVVNKGDYADYSFIRDTASIVVYSLDEAISVVNSLLSEGV